VKEKRRPIYDKLAKRYEGAIGPLERNYLSRLRARTLSHLPEGSRLLEIGAGTGLNFPHYPAGTCGAASEFSFEMLRLACGKPRPEDVRIVQNRAEELPFGPRTFDAAFATLVFCSIESPQAAFEELKRVVKPGGKIVLLEHVRPANMLGPAFDLLNMVTVPLFEDHFNRRTADTAVRSGLKIVNVERFSAGIIELIVCEV
jgi:phosphatidylethanolamine/phosphatidyl-N-methylethanolamine N-methyltransferase